MLRPLCPIAWIPFALAIFKTYTVAEVFGVRYTTSIFGHIQLGMLFVIFYGGFFPIFLNTVLGVKSVKDIFIESAQLLGADKNQLFRKVIVPSALPAILTGLRVGLGVSWMVIIAAEMLPGSDAGIGYLIMFSYELELALKAPHNVVFLDGSLVSYLIGIGQGLYAIYKSSERDNAPPELVNHFTERLVDTLNNYYEILISSKIERIYVGIPKYSSRNEIIGYINKFDIEDEGLKNVNDKGLLSLVLKAGDVVGPVKLLVGGRWRLHLDGLPDHLSYLSDQVLAALEDIYVLYFKPSVSHPTLRVEIAGEVARNKSRLSILLDALYDQSRIPGVIEPYPIHIADMFVKNVHGSLHVLREAFISDIGEIPGIDFSDIYLFLHNYRSEGGFE